MARTLLILAGLLAALGCTPGCGAPPGAPARGAPPSAAPDAGCALLPDLSPAQCDSVRGLQQPDALPAARGNAHADDAAAAQLGFRVFYDARFSSNHNVRCASCHQPERSFGDGLPVSQGLQPVARNAPTLLNAARSGWVFWDGRADTLWAQPIQALESPKEMNFSRLEVAHLLASAYATQYANAFGPLPDLSDASRFPAAGKPGEPAFDGMSPGDQQAINRVVANLGKAMEAYERKLATGPSALDRFLGGDSAALSDNAKRGLVVYAQAGCLSCHGGPSLSDDRFHNLGLPAAPGADADRGRAAGLPLWASDPFRSDGPFSDEPAPALPDAAPGAGDEGAFRTPSLRNVSKSAPYGHNGTLATLEEAVDFHLKGGGAGQVDPALQPHPLSDADRQALLEFLRALDGTYPAPPWNNWPNG